MYPGVFFEGTQSQPDWLVDLQVGLPPVTVPEHPLASHEGGELGQTTCSVVVVVVVVVVGLVVARIIYQYISV